MATWHSVPLHVSYQVLGWFAFFAWSISFYPQVYLNYRRKSVVGLNFDYAVLNMIKQVAYLIYNVPLYFSHHIQKQYHAKYGQQQVIPVALNDVAFSAHAVLLCGFTLYQIVIYERGTQKVSKIAIGITLGMLLASVICFFIALPHRNWLWLLNVLNVIQVILTIVKYIPQAVMNFMRKSTEGWSIGFILLDFAGGIANSAQMVMESIDQGSWKNIYGNIGKLLLALVTIFFDVIFICQHYLLYPHKKTKPEPTVEPENENDKSPDQPAAENNV